MLEKILVTQFLSELKDKLTLINQSIERIAHFPKADHKIKVAIGMRRVGKTFLLYQTIQKLLAAGIARTRILYINFEDDRLLPLSREKCAKLIEAFYELYPDNHDQRCYLFLDEIQNVPDWSTIVRRFLDTKNVDIYLTGSSSKLLSKEIATNLRGRSLAIEIFPYSFQEYLHANNIVIHTDFFDKKTQDKLSKHFQEYLMIGGFPEVIHSDFDVRIKTLQEYIDVVIYRDIIERHQIRYTPLLKYMIVFMLSNPGRAFTVNKFFNDVKSRGYQVNKDILYEYMVYIEDVYLAFPVSLYDPSIRRVHLNPKKIYAIDPGMVSAMRFKLENNLGWLFENVIFLDLKRQGCKIEYYLTKNRYEIDFLIQTPSGKQQLIQVCWDADNPDTFSREEKALQAAQKELKIDGKIITLKQYLQNPDFILS